MRLRWQVQALFNQDAGNASGASGGGAGGGNPGGDGANAGGAGSSGAPAAGNDGSLAAAAAAAKGSEPAAAAAADGWFPQGLDEKFKGKDAGETLTNLAKHFSEMPKAPAEAKDYTFKPADSIAQFFGTEADNKVLDVAKGVAHELGLTQSQFDGFINKFYGKAMEAGVLSRPVSPADEFTALGGKDGTPNEIAERGAQRVLAVADTLNGLETAGVLQKGEAAALISAMTKASEVIAMERIMTRLETVNGGPINGGKPGDGKTEHERRIERMYPTMVVS